jgi:alanine dehydrogenase
MLPGLAEVAEEVGLPFEAVELPGMVEADVIITITSSFAPTLLAEHVSPGHASRLHGHRHEGQAGGRGRPSGPRHGVLRRGRAIGQIGEAQHAVAEGLIAEGDIVQVGAVINGTHGGRASDEEVTLFDGTGVGLQDLAVSDAIVKAAVAQGTATIVQL